MTVSSVAVFPPGFRVTDADDNPISGATIEFYGAGTTTPKTVYSDADLTVAIGTSMSTDAGGYPTSGGNKVLVYTNQAPYKIVIKDAGGSAIITHDNVKGAVEGSSSSSSSTGTTGYGMAVGDVKLSLSASPDAGFVRLGESTQNLLKADYPELNAWAAAQTYPWGSTATTFGIPPAAGYFLRFGASSSAIDPSGPRSPGSTQADSYLNHSHTLTPGSVTVPDGVILRDGWGAGGTAINAGTNVTSGRLITGTGNNESTESLESLKAAQGNNTMATTTAAVTGAASAASTTGNAVETRAKNVAMYADMLALPSAVAESIVGASAFSYQYITSTTATDATAGKLGFNNATIGSATTFNINETDRYGSSLAAIFATLRAGSIVLITKVGSPANSIRFTTSTTFTDNGTYDSVTITTVSVTGTFADGDKVNVVVMPSGAPGSVGTSGSSILKGDGAGGIANATAGTDYTALAFKTIAVSGQSDVVADSASDTLTLAAGTGVTLTTNAGTDTITIASTWAGLSGTGFGSFNLTVPTLSANATLAILEQAQSFTGLKTFSAGLSIASGQTLDWNGDTKLTREAANTLALRNGTSAQTFNLYNTYTDASNYERVSLKYSANVAYLASEAAGTGTARTIAIAYNGTLVASFSTFGINLAQSLNFATDNTYNIGAIGNSPRTLYLGTGLGLGGTDPSTNTFLKMAVGTTAKSQMNWGTTSVAPTSPNNGDMWFDGTDLKIRIGGATKTVTVI